MTEAMMLIVRSPPNPLKIELMIITLCSLGEKAELSQPDHAMAENKPVYLRRNPFRSQSEVRNSKIRLR